MVTLHVSVWVEIFVLWIYLLFYIVTLHVSVWVEIIWKNIYKSFCITSRSTWACELKCINMFWTQITSPSHAPRERVSWNLDCPFFLSAKNESRSTWACELKLRCMPIPLARQSHAPRERVSWNPWSPAPAPHGLRHAPRERVSWNWLKHSRLDNIITSRSTWACELKLYLPPSVSSTWWSRSTWACELKYDI